MLIWGPVIESPWCLLRVGGEEEFDWSRCAGIEPLELYGHDSVPLFSPLHPLFAHLYQTLLRLRLWKVGYGLNGSVGIILGQCPCLLDA